MSQVTRRCYAVLVGLSKLRHKLSYETKKLLVEALVFPHIYYCCTVWGRCSATQKYRIQKAINFAARIVTGLARWEHVTPALEALGWVRFEGMFEKRDVALIRKLLSPDAPPALANLIQRRSAVAQRCTYPWNQWRPAGDAENPNRAREAAFSVQSCDRMEWQLQV